MTTTPATPATFSRAWSFDFWIAGWRMELRHQGRDAIPNVLCRLIHTRSAIGDCLNEEVRADLSKHGITTLRGFIGDATWSAYMRKNNGAAALAPAARGFIESSAGELGWSLDVDDEGDFERLWRLFEDADGAAHRLRAFLFGYKAIAVPADRGEYNHPAPVMSYSVSRDTGPFGEL